MHKLNSSLQRAGEASRSVKTRDEPQPMGTLNKSTGRRKTDALGAPLSNFTRGGHKRER